MKFAAAFFALLVGSVSVKATQEATIDEQSNAPLLRGRGLSAPDPNGAKTDRCLLVNLKTMTESTIETTTALKYNFAEAGSAGWSVKCFGEAGKNVDYVKFFYDGENVSTQYFSPERIPKASDQPFWMRGDNKGGDVNPVDYLNSAGDKQFTVKFYTWPGGDQYPSDKKQYFLNGGGPEVAPSKCTGVVCPFNSSCDKATGACNCIDSYVLKGGACVSPSKCDGVTCPASSACNEATGACQCTGSLVLKNGACVPPSKCDGVTCTGGSACEEATGTCKCAAGQVLKDNVCVAKPKCDGVTCPANSACDEATGICSICSAGFEFKFGVCTPIDRCGGVTCRHIHGAVCDPLTGKCGCRPKFVLEHGLLCLPACYRNLCPLGSYCSHITGDCMCHVPNQQLLNGVCRCPINKSDAFGVATGIPFDQGNGIVGCPQVIQAKLQADANVIRLGVLILHPYKWVEDGGVGGTSFGLSHFAHGEFISEVVACKDATAITYMKISTSKKRAIEGGIINGDCQVFKPIIGRAIVGFFGTATQRIHSIGVVYGPVPNLS